MPNWTENTLTIILPAEKKSDLLSFLEGPADWAIPAAAFHDFERPEAKLSNHDKIAFDRDSEKLIGDFKAFMAPYGWPEWMKPSRKDIEIFYLDPEKIRPQIVPFSVAKLAPWKGPEEFAGFFPDAAPEGDFWAPMEVKDSMRYPIIELRYAKIGPKWPPGSIRLEEMDLGNGKSRIDIRYTTPWSPLTDIAGLMQATLLEYGAKMLLQWVEEQGLCGYTYLDPAKEAPILEEDFDTDHDWYQIHEEDDGESFQHFDYDVFSESVAERIDDPDFQ